VGNTDQIETLTQAYMALGILRRRPSPESPTPDLTQAPAASPANFLARLHSSRTFLESLQEIPVPVMRAMEPEELQQMSEAVAALSEVCDAVNDKLEAAKKGAGKKRPT